MMKVGVGVLDHLSKSNVEWNTRFWPMVIFHDLLNIVAISAYCIQKASQ
jgi:hypothetical protein